MGWRLGGKGASGRGAYGRIEEHGFHVWMGFYENAFRLMRECYKELGRDPRTCKIADWRDAFFPAPFIGFSAPQRDGSFAHLLSYFPPADGLPGDPLTDNNPFTLASYLSHTAAALRTMLSTVDRPSAAKGSNKEATTTATPIDELLKRIASILKYGLMATTAGLIDALGIIEVVFGSSFAYGQDTLVRLVEAVAQNARVQLEKLLANDEQSLLTWHAVDLGLTAMLGILRFGLLNDPSGFDAINEYDFREWMKLNGATDATINSPLVRAAYDLAFAYEDGDYNKPRHGAGVGLRGSLRMLFTYRGAIVWKMSAGMGDIVFAPLYEVLKRRGVKFRFFHRLERVVLADAVKLAPNERPYVEALEFDVQAEIRDGGEYQPLVDIGGLPCWPSTPDYSQLEDGERLRVAARQFESHWDRRKSGSIKLNVIDDFDFVVLGIGGGAVPYVCQDLIARDGRWRAMVDRIKTVETQAFQLWIGEDLEALGWRNPPLSQSGFVQPFESWTDMSHLAAVEGWPRKPSTIAYFCSTLAKSLRFNHESTDYPKLRREQVRQSIVGFLEKDLRMLWPGTTGPDGRFKWNLLLNPERTDGAGGGAGSQDSGFDSQFLIANVDPTERYVISVPGSQRFRISPLDNTFDNFTVAGDWTACGLDTGCVEAAVMSGKLAAHAISLRPALEEIIGYDHP
jgi:uncharacterized protein with NAD-binding domain and iron-sulfur cluster